MAYINLQIKSAEITALLGEYEEDLDEHFDYCSPMQIQDDVVVFEFENTFDSCDTKCLEDVFLCIAAGLSNGDVVCLEDIEEIEEIGLDQAVESCIVSLFENKEELVRLW